ncbi:MAG: hypothetical protein ABI792_03440 [bacterium]
MLNPVLNIEFSQKIIAPEIPGHYYSRDRLIRKIQSFKSKRLILITAPAGYGKTSFSAEYFHKLKKELKLWISISTYDNSIENFFLLLALAFENNLPSSNFSTKLKAVLYKSQNIPVIEKIDKIISSFSSELYLYLRERNKQLYIFLDDFHNIDESDEVCAALNYFLEYLPWNINFVFISRRDPKKINYPKFLAKNWLGRITKDNLLFDDSDIENFIKLNKKSTNNLDKELLEEFLKNTEGWVTAIQLLLMTNNYEVLKNEDLNLSRNDIFEYFTKEIYENCTAEEKSLLLVLSYPESFDKNIIENVLGIEKGYDILLKLYQSNVFINKEDETYRLHELLRKFLNKIAAEEFKKENISGIYKRLGNFYLKNQDWREDYIALNYLILGEDYETLKQWIKLNASDKLLLIHSSGLFHKIEDICDENFRRSLEYILLKVNTFIYKDKDVGKATEYLENILKNKFSLGANESILIPVNKIKKHDVNYYVELLMLLCNCNFLKEGIGIANIPITEHILKFRLRMEQEIQFIVSLIKSYITTGRNLKNKKYIQRLKDIFNKILSNSSKGIKEIDENILVESTFSMLIFFDYGDYKTGNQVIRFIQNNFDFKNFDLSNYSQVCFALFASYNAKEFEIFYNYLADKNKEKNQTIFSAYKNQFEFQSILKGFLDYQFKQVVKDLEFSKKHTFLKNYIYFIDSLILYCYNLTEQASMVSQLLNQENYFLSKTRKLIILLEASLLSANIKAYHHTLKEINKIKKENFTIFNQAVILFCECYFYSLNKDLKNFKERFLKFAAMSEEYEYFNYIIFRAKANKLRYVFEYALDNDVGTVYLKDIFTKNDVPVSSLKRRSVQIEIHFLNHCKIFINGKALPDTLWLRAKSKSIFLYFVYKTLNGSDITKETIIDDLLYNSKNVNYDAIADVEINKVRKVIQTFLSEIFSEKISKEVFIIKDKKYFITSKNFITDIRTDIEEFKSLASSPEISNKLKAFELYKTDFASESFQNWAEDVRENLKFVYSEVIHKLISHYEKEEDNKLVMKMLEKLIDIDYNDDEIILKLLSIYNKNKDFRKFKFLYRFYEKRLKKEFNIEPPLEIKNYFNEVAFNS